MIFIAHLQNNRGWFEADTRRKLIEKIAQFYGENGGSCSLEAVFYETRLGKSNQLCTKAVDKIQKKIDDKISEWQKVSNEEYLARQEIRQEFQCIFI